ncbi:hypothetical protein LCGC14_0267580 [marine sediment metagenome]|uniref:Uncharacterized protein n=1 Tax=marine sediment metagenome TaxID=412755 RepID=A0A0F9UGT6_9ZZZZ
MTEHSHEPQNTRFLLRYEIEEGHWHRLCECKICGHQDELCEGKIVISFEEFEEDDEFD